MHVAESGPEDGPAVVLCHGFPEMLVLVASPAAAPSATPATTCSLPTSGGTAPPTCRRGVDEYTMLHLVGDIVGVLDAFGIDSAVVVGHDWGGPVAWHCALLRPDRFHAVAGLSVHFGGIAPVPTPRVTLTDAMRAAFGDGFLYILYFQEPGVAERELDADLRRTLGAILYGLSGDVPRDQFRFFDPSATLVLRRGARAARVRSTGCRTRISTCSSSRSGTTARSPAASTGTATSTATRSCSAPFAGRTRRRNPRCSSAPSSTSIFGQTRRRCSPPAARCRTCATRCGSRARGTGSSRRSPSWSTRRCWGSCARCRARQLRAS